MKKVSEILGIGNFRMRKVSEIPGISNSRMKKVSKIFQYSNYHSTHIFLTRNFSPRRVNFLFQFPLHPYHFHQELFSQENEFFIPIITPSASFPPRIFFPGK